jgi:competence protein ComEA
LTRIRLLATAALLLVLRTAFAAVDANSASADDLETIPGIGPATAKRIVEERAKGPFKGLEDLQVRVRGIGESRIRKMSAAGLTVVPGAVPVRSRRDEARAAQLARDARLAAGGAAGAVSADRNPPHRAPPTPRVHEGGVPAPTR